MDAVFRPGLRARTVPAWTLWLLRGQIAIPYVFGGVAKLNTDWLHGAPMRIMLADKTEQPLIGRFLADEWMVQFFTYGGLFFDLLVVPLLLWRRTRAAALVVAMLFHLTNAALFQIGIFPWFMIAATLIFLPSDWPRRLWRLPRKPGDVAVQPVEQTPFRRRTTVALLAAYLAVQVLLPLRHFLYPGNVDWTEEGSRFAWRMMLRSKSVGVSFYETDPASGRTAFVDPLQYLTPRQFGKMGNDPDLILQFSHYLARELKQGRHGDVEIRAKVLASLNGRKAQRLINPKVNLAAEPRSLKPGPWIVPLAEPLPDKPKSVR